MSFRRCVKLLIRRSRRPMTVVALLAYLASVWGYPLPRAGSADASTPFPCQHHHCGCHSAQQCWQSCCCFSLQERVAWARKHNVAVPANVQLASAADRDEHVAATDHEEKSCCKKHDHEAPDLCRQRTAARGEEAKCSQCPTPSGDQGVIWVLGIEARKCQGLSTSWIASGASLPLEILPLWEFDWIPAGHVVTASESSRSLSFDPPVPPPRAQAAALWRS
jgi:hypothetical protein